MVRTVRRRTALLLGLVALVAGATGGTLFWERVQAGIDQAALQGANGALWSGSIVLRNDGAAAATVVINFYNTTGVLVKSYAVPGTVPAKATISVDTESVGDLPAGFAGAAVVSANQPVSASFVGYDATNNSVHRTIYNGFSDGADTVYVPSISNNYSDQVSVLAVQNVDSAPATVIVRYFERFTGAQSAQVTDTIPPSSSHFYDASNLPGGQQLAPPWTGDALIQASGGRVVAAVHQPYLNSNRATAFEGTASVGTEAYFPSVVYQAGGQNQTSFISVQNAQGTPVNVTLNFYNATGILAGSTTGVLQGYQKQSFNAGSGGVPPGFDGTASVRATGPVAAVANVGSPSASVAAYTGRSGGSIRQSLPFIRWSPSGEALGWRTSVEVMNIDQTFPLDLTIRYYDQNGTLVNAPSFRNVAPNSKVVHNPGIFIGDSPFSGSVEVEASRGVIATVNASTVDGSQSESYTGMPMP